MHAGASLARHHSAIRDLPVLVGLEYMIVAVTCFFSQKGGCTASELDARGCDLRFDWMSKLGDRQ
jgi:hypothetical protein